MMTSLMTDQCLGLEILSQMSTISLLLVFLNMIDRSDKLNYYCYLQYLCFSDVVISEEKLIHLWKAGVVMHKRLIVILQYLVFSN